MPDHDLSEAASSSLLRSSKNEFIRALLLCFLAVFLVRSFVLEPFKIPSSSMTPTLLIGDYIFVSKFDFGFMLPFSKVELIRWSEPKRGDIVVFKFPRDESLHYVKRVVGIPGDRIQFQGRVLKINGETVPQQPVAESEYRSLGLAKDSEEIYVEKLGAHEHWVKFAKNGGEGEGSKVERVVPKDQFFVVGDSRDDSYDSRSWGFVPRSLLKGRARLIWFSIDSLSNWESLDKVRWKRCGTILH